VTKLAAPGSSGGKMYVLIEKQNRIFNPKKISSY
jgi:hypothetical protein